MEKIREIERTSERQYGMKSNENCHRVGRMKASFHSIINPRLFTKQFPPSSFTYFPLFQSYTGMKTHIIE